MNRGPVAKIASRNLASTCEKTALLSKQALPHLLLGVVKHACPSNMQSDHHGRPARFPSASNRGVYSAPSVRQTLTHQGAFLERGSQFSGCAAAITDHLLSKDVFFARKVSRTKRCARDSHANPASKPPRKTSCKAARLAAGCGSAATHHRRRPAGRSARAANAHRTSPGCCGRGRAPC